MVKYKKRVPELRFKGFKDDWEQRKLSEVTKSFSGGTPSVGNELYYNGEIPFIRSAEINSEKTELFLSQEGINNSSAKIVDKGDILYALYGATSGEVGVSKIDGAINQAILAMKPKMGYDSYFITQWLKKRKAKIIGTYLQGGQGNLSGAIVKDLKLKFPKGTEEQKMIGEFFKQLDDTIALHQQKLDHLRQMKKGMVQLIFPLRFMNTPFLRFTNFHDPWEPRKVGEFLSESKIPGTNGVLAKKLTVKLWGKGVVPRDDVIQGSIVTKYYIRHAGQFIYGKLDFLHQAFGIIPDHLDGYESTLDSPAFDIRDNLNPIFLLEYVSRKSFYLYHGTIADGSRKAKRIHTETFFNMPLMVPNKLEQILIGTFLKYFDDTISLHQQKLDSLQLLKKSYLKKMFV